MFYLVGLPDSAVKESHQRIISALQVNGYRMPTSNIVINMAPADIRKEGAAYDLPLAIGILAASEVIQSDKLERYLLMGELSLDGSLQPIKGALPIAIKARELGFEGMIVPQQNAHNHMKTSAAIRIRLDPQASPPFASSSCRLRNRVPNPAAASRCLPMAPGPHPVDPLAVACSQRHRETGNPAASG